MQHLQKTTGGVEIMVNQVLGTSQPSFFLLPCSVPPLLCGWSAFRLPYTLPSSVCCNPFICHSYENTGGVGYSSHFGTSPAPSKPALIGVLSSALLPPLQPRKRARNAPAHP